jgi:hypothetical protein
VALDVINQARRLRPVDPEVFNVIGHALLEHEHPAQAARWFTTGLVRALGQPADHLDEIFDRYRTQRASE